MKTHVVSFVRYSCVLLFWLLLSCGQRMDVHIDQTNQTDDEFAVTDIGAKPGYKIEPLLWEPYRADSKKWSRYVYKLFRIDLIDTLDQADDMNQFCPNFKNLDFDQKANVWAILVSVIAKYESGFEPTSRMLEKSMGTDVITHQPVYSEGLLQLSYQDITRWSFCRFDWNKDHNLSTNDSRKTILNPFLNLDCGVKILAEQIQLKHRIVLSESAYWAVIKSDSEHQKISEIRQEVAATKLCYKH